LPPYYDLTECVKDLDLQSKMVIFESNLTNFKFSAVFFVAAGAVVKIGLSLKPNHHKDM